MNTIQRILTAVNKSKWDSLFESFLKGDAAPGMSSGSTSLSGDATLKFTAVFACCRVLAETFATVPIFEYRKVSDDDRVRTNETGLYDLLHYAPNEDMTAFSWKEMAMYQVNLGGNATFIRGENRFGEVVALYPRQWQDVTIEREKETRRLTYLVQEDNETKKYYRNKVFHVAGPSLDGVVGMSPIEYAREAINLGKTYEDFQSNFYKNGTFSTGVFTHPGRLEDEAFTRLKDDLKKKYAGMINGGQAMLLEDGLTFNPLSMKLVDAELLSSKKFQIEDICRIFRVPLHLVQNLDKATNNNIEHQSLEFVMYTMLPHFKRWEEAINTQLLTKEQRDAGYYFEFNVSTLLRGDSKSMAEAFATGRQWGWLSVNDIRRMLNMNKIDNGDIYLTPLNMAEAGAVPESSHIRNEIRDEILAIMKGGK